jgi:hypothetical protein
MALPHGIFGQTIVLFGDLQQGLPQLIFLCTFRQLAAELRLLAIVIRLDAHGATLPANRLQAESPNAAGRDAGCGWSIPAAPAPAPASASAKEAGTGQQGAATDLM